MPANWYPISGETDNVIGGVTVRGIYEVSEGAGQQAPEKKVERGYTWSTRVGAEPIQITANAWLNPPVYESLAALRDERAPISVSIGGATLSTAVLDSLSQRTQGAKPGAYDTEIEIRQIQQGSTTTIGVRADAASGPKSSAPGGGGGGSTGTTGGRVV